MTDVRSAQTALDNLIEAVEAGDPIPTGRAADNGQWDCGSAIDTRWSLIIEAYHGSLDAALALHEALLPGWEYCAESNWCTVQYSYEEFSAKNDKNPARAWLLAILRAYRSVQQ